MEIIAAIAGFVILIVCLVLATPGCSGGRAAEDGQPGAKPPVVSAGEMQVLDRDAVRAMLKKVADSPPPQSLKMGAMCYDMAGPPQRADYVCPKCGERTLYEQGMAGIVEWQLPACRRELAELKKATGEAAALDESQFCRKCSPDAKEPKLALNLKYQGGQKSSVAGVTPMDIRLVREFLTGKMVHQGEQDRETAMKDHLPRLKELLGVKGE